MNRRQTGNKMRHMLFFIAKSIIANTTFMNLEDIVVHDPLNSM